jgi:TetR/AcrR family transcriptional regulator
MNDLSRKMKSTSKSDRDGATERRILDAARTVFMRRGTSGARMQEIAEEAGVNQALLHYYFRSKDGLSEAVFREAAGRLVPAVASVLESDDSLERKVEQFVHLYIDTVRKTPFLPGYILAEMHHHPERLPALAASVAGGLPAARTKTLRRRLDAELRARAAAGTMRPIEAEQFLINVLALCVFPFVARPMLGVVFGMDESAFERFLDERRAELPGFIFNAVRP